MPFVLTIPVDFALTQASLPGQVETGFVLSIPVELTVSPAVTLRLSIASSTGFGAPVALKTLGV